MTSNAASDHPRVSPDLAIGVLVLVWGANFSVVKAALADFHPLAFNALRFVLASALLALALRASSVELRFTRADWPALIGLGVLGNTFYQVLFIYGIDWTLAGNAALMLSTVPMFVTVLAVLYKHERVGHTGWTGVGLSMLGVALVVWGSSRNVRFGASTVRGDLTMLAAAGAWSVYTVGSTPLVRRYGALPVTAVTLWIGSIGLVALSLPALLGQEWAAVSGISWAGLLYSGALSIALAYLLWYYGVRHLGGSRTAVYSNTIPIVALLVAWATLGEVPTGLQMGGAAAIVVGATLSRFARSGPAAPGRPAADAGGTAAAGPAALEEACPPEGP